MPKLLNKKPILLMTFTRKQFTRPSRQPLTPLTHQVKYINTEKHEPRPKGAYVRSKSYRMAVARLSCFRCGVAGFSNACHGDADKGAGMKTSDLTCWPGCTTRPGIEGCHHYVGRVMPRDERRAFEIAAAEDTKLRLIAASQESGAEAQRLRELLRKLEVVR